MTHLDETTIELYVLNAPEVESEREQVEAHIAECDGCRETYTAMADFYADVETDMAAGENLPAVRDEELPERIEQSLRKKYYDRGPLRPIEVGPPFRIARWVVKHPYTTAGGAVATVGLLVALLFLTLKPPGNGGSEQATWQKLSPHGPRPTSRRRPPRRPRS